MPNVTIHRTLGERVFARTAGAPLIGGNAVRLLRDAAENYPAWLAAIESARSFVHFENYMICSDRVGERFADALIAKAGQGVPVRVVYDWFGCLGRARSRFWRRLRAGGVDVRGFNPPRATQPFGWIERDHRKCIVVDGRIAFVTGLCVGTKWEGDAGRAAWRDTGVEISGPAVTEVARAFADMWATIGTPLPPGELPDANAPPPPAGDMESGVVATTPGSGNLYRLDPLVASVAKRTLWLTDAYFAGTSVYVQSLRAAAGDGVDVRLLVPGPGSDLPLMQTISRAGYRALLDAGIRLFEWNGPMLHAKTAVADARWSRVGSSNLNLASWIGNHELDLFVENEAFGRQMEQMFQEDLTNSTEIVLRRWARVRPVVPRHAHRYPRAGGSGSRAAAGALRVGNAIGSVLTARRVHGPAERWLMAEGGIALIVLALAGFFFPRLIAWPLAALSIWLGLVLLVNGARKR